MKACFHVKTSYLPDAESGDDDKGDASNVHGQPAASSASSDCSPCLKQCEEISQVMTVLSDEKDSDASSKVKQPKRRWTEGELEAFICAFGHYITKKVIPTGIQNTGISHKIGSTLFLRYVLRFVITLSKSCFKQKKVLLNCC